MAKTEDRLKAIELAKQGHSKSEIAKTLNVSRQTIYEWLKEENTEGKPEEKLEENGGVDNLIAKYDSIGNDIQRHIDDDVYGQVIARIMARHGIFMDGHVYDRVDKYINRYDVDDLEYAIELVQKFRDMGLEPDDLMPGNNPKDMQYYSVFLKFLKMPEVNKTIDVLVKEGMQRSDSIFYILNQVIMEWRSMGFFDADLKHIGDEVASKLVEQTVGIADKRLSDLEKRYADRMKKSMEQAMNSFNAMASKRFQKAVDEEMNKLNTILNNMNRLLEDINEKQVSLAKKEKEKSHIHLIGGIMHTE